MRRPLHHTKCPAHRGRTNPLHARALIGPGLCNEEPIHVAAEAFLLLRVGYRRAQHLLDVARDELLRELERRKRLRDVASADLIEDEARLLRRRADVPRGRVRFDHDFSLPPPTGAAPPPPPAPAPPPPAGAAAAAAAANCAAFSAFVVWPLKNRVGANSPSFCPTMFS